MPMPVISEEQKQRVHRKHIGLDAVPFIGRYLCSFTEHDYRYVHARNICYHVNSRHFLRLMHPTAMCTCTCRRVGRFTVFVWRLCSHTDLVLIFSSTKVVLRMPVEPIVRKKSTNRVWCVIYARAHCCEGTWCNDWRLMYNFIITLP